MGTLFEQGSNDPWRSTARTTLRLMSAGAMLPSLVAFDASDPRMLVLIAEKAGSRGQGITLTVFLVCSVYED